MERPASWFEPDCDYENECDGCDKLNKKLENAKEFVESLVEMMYSKEKLDVDLFTWRLEEACSYLDIGFPINDIQIKRK